MEKPNYGKTHGVSRILAIAIIIVLVATAAGGYYLLKGTGSSSPLGSLSSFFTTSGSTSTSSQVTTGSENTSGAENFTGTFQWSSISNSSFDGKPLNTDEKASGNFAVTISLSNDSGQGIGQGQATFEWSGQCTGQNSSSYTFTVSAQLAPTATGSNLTIFFGPANPSGSTLLRTCQNFPSSSESWSWVSVGSPSPVSIAQGQTIEGANSFDFGDVTYEITLLQS